ncbi:unnamed protein product [Caenorhabditis auriculariae]|uniref:Uncharacterized protein n=1 Tax=Caenorhabditis auriculariae TaxID=2777116 RepID=A0A8S1H925_9PELO|nr:unnamed protein product [Caenorhabditis auriculariae]
MLVVGDHDFKIPSRHTQGRICHWSQSTDYHQDRTSANRLGAPTPLKRYKRRMKEKKIFLPPLPKLLLPPDVIGRKAGGLQSFSDASPPLHERINEIH